MHSIKINRPEGPIVSRPGRQTGNRIKAMMIAKGAALQTIAGAGPSGLIPGISVYPELTLGAIHWRRFAPRFRFFLAAYTTCLFVGKMPMVH